MHWLLQLCIQEQITSPKYTPYPGIKHCYCLKVLFHFLLAVNILARHDYFSASSHAGGCLEAMTFLLFMFHNLLLNRPWPVPRGWPAKSWAAKSPEKRCNTCHSFPCVWCKSSHHGCMLRNDLTVRADAGGWARGSHKARPRANHLPTSRLLPAAGIRILYLLWYSFILLCFAFALCSESI